MNVITSRYTRQTVEKSIKSSVLQYLGISEFEYGLMQYEIGLCYLSIVLNNTFYEEYLQRSRLFWDWWKYQWLIRDVLYLYTIRFGGLVVDGKGNISLDSCYLSYAQNYDLLNSPYILASDSHPNGIHCLDTFTNVIAYIIDINQ